MASLGLFAALYPDGPDLSFFTWLLATIPICALLLLLIWVRDRVESVDTRAVVAKSNTPPPNHYMQAQGVLSCRFGRGDLPPISAEALDARLAALGRVSFEGKVVLVTFVLVIVAWLTRAPVLSLRGGGGVGGWVGCAADK